MLLARERVRFSGLLTLAIFNAVVQVFVDWLSVWDYRSIQQWDLLQIISLFSVPVGVYFVCAVSVPETEGGAPIDMDAFYWKNRRLYYSLWFVLLFFYLGACLPLARSNPQLALQEALANVPFFAPILLALSVNARWAQWVAGVGLLILCRLWPIAFSSMLH